VRPLFRLMLRLYPPSHRRSYGEEMLQAVEYRLGSGGTGRVGTMIALGDFAWGAFGVWMDKLGRMTMGGVSGWFLDVRYLTRSLRRSPGYVFTAVLVLACAVAVNATVFSYVRGTLLADPGYPAPDRLMVVWGSNVEDGQLRDVISGPAYIQMQGRVSAFEELAAFNHDGAYLMVDGRPEVIDAIEGTVGLLGALGIEPVLGRGFDESDRTSGAPGRVIVTHQFWQDRLEGDPDAVGTALPLDSGPTTIIGVLPEGFEFVAPAPLFLPLRDDVLAADEPGRIHYNVLGRLAPGAGIADASTQLAEVARQFTAEYPGFEGWSFLVEPMQEVAVESVRPVIWTLTAVVTLVLLVALVNLATLFRVRALTRAPELGIRMAIGAGRFRVLRVLLLEVFGLVAAGTVVGLLVTPTVLGRVTAVVPEWIPIPESAGRVPALQALFDPEVALVALAVAMAGALVLTAPSLVAALRSAQPSRTRRTHGALRGTRVLVGVELAAATLLCLSAGLVIRSADHLLSTDVGIEEDGLLVLYFGDVWERPAAEQVEYYRQTVAAVEALPGVETAGVMDYVDFQAEDDFARIYVLDAGLEPSRNMREEWRRVDDGLFEAAGMRMLAGRAFDPDDFQGPPRTAIVNEAFARKHWPDRSPLGAYLSTHDENYEELEVVGVLEDVRSLGPGAPAPPMLYVPNQGSPRGTQGMYVRVTGEPMSHAGRIREAIWSMDPSQPIAGITPMSALVEAWVAIPRATRTLVVGLALLTLLLSAVGVFGIVSYAVRTRRSEFGVRLALGATADRLGRDQILANIPVVGLGIAVGLVAGVVGARAARSLLYGVTPLDPISITAAVTVLAGAAFLAMYLPTRRVARIDPTEAMRAD